MKGLILGAGYATRLYPLTLNRPKPLLPLGGIPILERICEQMIQSGAIDAITVVTNHCFAHHFQEWLRTYLRQRKPPVQVTILDDGTSSPETRLGAIGDIQFALDRGPISEDLLVMAGDNLITEGLEEFIRMGIRRGAAVGLKDVRSREKARLYGVVSTDSEGRIIGFVEKPQVPASTLVAVGLYFFPKDTLPLVGRYLATGHNKDAPGHYLQWLHRQIPVYGRLLEGDWFDIGDRESYQLADDRMSSSSSSS